MKEKYYLVFIDLVIDIKIISDDLKLKDELIVRLLYPKESKFMNIVIYMVYGKIYGKTL